MEILKFDEGDTKPKSRKFSSRGSILVAAVAIMFGASTALAGSTLSINTNNLIEISQGVAKTVQCDDNGVNISLETAFVPGTTGEFKLSKIKITGINASATSGTTGIGCLGKFFTVKLYDNDSATADFCVVAEDGCVGGNSVSKEVTADSLTYTLTPTLVIDDKFTLTNVTIVSSNA
jgi:hypothetical protein